MVPDASSVSLEIPARADFVGLARLALSAVCGRASLDAERLADLKLALTEAASAFVAEDAASVDDGADRLSFEFALEPERLVIEIVGSARRRQAGAEERELSQAILAATVDEWGALHESVRLVKYLDLPGH